LRANTAEIKCRYWPPKLAADAVRDRAVARRLRRRGYSVWCGNAIFEPVAGVARGSDRWLAYEAC